MEYKHDKAIMMCVIIFSYSLQANHATAADGTIHGALLGRSITREIMSHRIARYAFDN